MLKEGKREEGSGTDKYVTAYNANADGLTSTVKGKLGKKEMNGPQPDNTAPSATRSAALAQETATLRVEGDPTILVNSTVTISGVLKRHTGNWLVKKVSHEIGTGGYITTLTLARNASKVGSVAPKGGVNTSVGGKEGRPQEKTLKKYDKDGNPI